VMFYVLFGLLLNRGHEERGVIVAAYLMATYGTFGVMGASLFGFGAGLASERGLGWLEVKRASPMPPFAYFVAKTIVCMAFSLIIILILLSLGVLLGGVQISIATAAKLVATLVVGASAFCAMGMAIGYFAGPHGSVSSGTKEIRLDRSFNGRSVGSLVPSFVPIFGTNLGSRYVSKQLWST